MSDFCKKEYLKTDFLANKNNAKMSIEGTDVFLCTGNYASKTFKENYIYDTDSLLYIYLLLIVHYSRL